MATSDVYQLMYQTRFNMFAELAFTILHPGETLLRNWHIDVLAHRLSHFVKNAGERLIINLPPRSLKSFLTSIAMPAFMLGRDPRRKILILAGTPELADDLRLKLTKLLRSSEFQSIFPHIEFDSSKRTLVMSQGGSLSVLRYGEAIIGKGYDVIILDDPQSPIQAKDPEKRVEAFHYFNTSVQLRLNSKALGSIVLVQQRLGWQDLSGSLRTGWDRLVISAIARCDETWRVAGGKVKRPGGTVIFEARETLEGMKSLLSSLGPADFATQYLQDPFWGDDNCPYKVVRAWEIPQNWDRENHYLPEMWVRVYKQQTLEEVYFNGPRSRFVFDDPNAEFNDDAWEKQAIAHQRKLVREVQEDWDRRR